MRIACLLTAFLLLVQLAVPALAQYPATKESLEKAEEKKHQELTLPMIGLFESDLPRDPCLRSKTIGIAAASYQHGQGGWIGGSFLATLFLGPIGLIGAITMAVIEDNKPYTFPEEVTDERCYVDAYRGKARSNMVMGAVTGSLIGAATLSVLIAIASNQ